MRYKLLAIGRDEVTARLESALLADGFATTRLKSLPDSLNSLKQEKFDMALLDGALKDFENTCFRITWFCRLRSAIIDREPPPDIHSLLPHLGAEHYIQAGIQTLELIRDIEILISLGPPRFDAPRILVIEDDHHIQEAVRLSFRIFWPECELFFTGEGQTGINIIRSKPMDMIILDLGLPDMNGFDILKWVRNFSRAPVIILSAARDQSNVVRAIQAGANDYIVKPFKQIELLPRIRKYIHQYSCSR